MPSPPTILAPLPPPPVVRASVVRDLTAGATAQDGFVNVRRLEIAVIHQGGEASPPIRFDIATRKAIDAVVVVAHFEEDGVRQVYLRSCPRPALMLHEENDGRPSPRDGNLWELAAGLIEPGESPRTGAARELHEELGFLVAEDRLVPLGSFTYPAPGFIAERHHYFHVDVDPLARAVPTEDGSPLEAHALVVSCPLEAALAECRAGAIVDAKTELALRRLEELFP